VRVVDLRLEPGWKPVLRTNGFGNPHYQAGNFRTASGRAVKIFSTGTDRLVLLPPSSANGTPVLLDAADPDQFVARVRKEWSNQ
jgi:Bacterial PH domain